MKQDVQFGPVVLLLHDDDGEVLVPLDNIGVVFVTEGSTCIVLKAPVGAAAAVVRETPAEVQACITKTLNDMVQSLLSAYR